MEAYQLFNLHIPHIIEVNLMHQLKKILRILLHESYVKMGRRKGIIKISIDGVRNILHKHMYVKKSLF